MPEAVTLRDVAKLAGVSIGTASQALNNRPHVLPETRKRVLEACQALGYSPRKSNAAQSRPRVIGMLTKHDEGSPPPALNFFFSHVQAGVEQACRANHINLMVASVPVDRSNHPISWPRLVEEKYIDGVLLVGLSLTKEELSELQNKLGRPVVLVDSYVAGVMLDSVLIDNIGGAMQAVTHLIDLGHRHIGLIGSNPASPPDVLERREGYLRALAARGITQTFIEDSAMLREAGQAALPRLLERAPLVTAVFVTNDDTAIGVLRAAQAMRLRVPEDLAIVGFDDIDLAREIHPTLTTVRVHKTWLGKIGVQCLIQRLQEPDRPPVVVRLATELVERETTREVLSNMPLPSAIDCVEPRVVSLPSDPQAFTE
ncbi:MAG: LacI family DNA-binding transcriptional regulator [Thermoflexales bacterium]